MNIRPAISAPLPWLTILTAKFYGKSRDGNRRPILKLPRTLKFTKEGRRFTAILLVIGIAAINTGNNLLYLVVAMLLSLIIISGILSESTLRNIRVRRTVPRHIFKGVPATVRLLIENKKRFFPSYSFIVREDGSIGFSALQAYVLKLDKAEASAMTSRYTFVQRGRVKLKGFRIETRFPFGLFIKGRDEMSPEEVLVYPSIRPVNKDFLIAGFDAGGSSLKRKGGGTQLYSLRDYTLQDDSRFIHWKSTAKASRTIAKEFETETEKKVFVVFENYSKDGGEVLFEEKVDEAAAIASHFIEKNYSVGLKTPTSEIAPRPGREHLYKILHALALIKPLKERGTPEVRVMAL